MPPISLSALSALSPATSSVIFSVNSAGGVKLVEISPSPSPEPTTTETATPDPSPSPAPTVTVTQTVAPAGPSEVSGTVKLDGGQYLGLTSGLVLMLVFLSALLVAQMRRP
jgi:hypothetical protein